MTDFLADVRRYDPEADEETVDIIVKHLGIALQSRDASLVSCSDADECARVREKWCMKRLGMTNPDHCNAAIAHVCRMMGDRRDKHRVTFYYLVARQLGRLGSL